MWDHNSGRSKGYGFVSFRTKEDAAAAIEIMNGEQIGSRRVRCGWAQHKQEEAQPVDEHTVDRADPINTNVRCVRGCGCTQYTTCMAHTPP